MVAHRGSSAARPEHTLGAYELAIDEGADSVECDVRLTADQHLVCVHDRRVNRTSDGQGVVSDLTLKQLQSMDFGAWKGESAAVLTLHELLDLLAAAPRRVDIAIETKHPQKYGGDLEQALAALLQSRGLLRPVGEQTRVRVMSFSVLALRNVGRLMPTLPRVLLCELGLIPTVRAGQLPDGIPTVGISTTLLRRDPAIVARHHARGHTVHVYTVDDSDDLQRCLDLGADAIISNRPRMVRTVLDMLAQGHSG